MSKKPPQRIMVTGAAGFVGSHLVEHLLDAGRDVIAIDNFHDYYDPSRKQSNADCFRQRDGITFYEADIRDADAIRRIFRDHEPQAVAHLAALANVRYSIGRASEYTDVNVTASVLLLEAARQVGCDQFVFASTSSVYGKTDKLPFEESDPCNHPLAPYPASKKAVEVMGYTYHNLHEMNFTAVRFFSVYGPRGRPDMMPFMVTDRIVKGETIKLFDGGQMKRDWTYVEDIVAGVAAALDRPLGYQLINLGRGEPVLMADFVHIIEQLVGKKAVLETPPAPASEPPVTFANIEKARKLLAYAPQTPIHDGLAKLWAWYQAEMAE